MLSKYLLSYKETAHLLGVTPRHVQRLVKAGVIPSITLGAGVYSTSTHSGR